MEPSTKPNRTHSNQTIARQLERARKATSNALNNPEIAALLIPYGYDAAEVKTGSDLYKAGLAAVTGKTDLHGQQHYTTEQIEHLEERAHQAFQDLAQIARAVFKGQPSRLDSLGLNGPMPEARADFIMAAQKLFTTAQTNPDIAPILARRGYPAERIRSEYEHITTFIAATDTQSDAIGIAQESTTDQTTALATMNNWVDEFLRVARVALRGRAQLLEALGITVRTRKRPAEAAPPPIQPTSEPTAPLSTPPITPSA